MSACTGGVSSCHIDGKIGCDNKDDSPAESFFLSKADELDWIDRNAFIDRKVTSVNNLINSDFQIPNNPASDSLAGSPIVALPKPHKADKRRRRRIRLFPKRSSGASVAEPSSPKVSCTGRVRSRSRRGKKQAEPAITRSRSRKKRGFCWISFRGIFRRERPKRNVADPPPPLGAVKRFSSARRSDAWAADAAESERPPLPLGRDVLKSDPPSLGVMPRFSSARRSDAWVADLQEGGAES